MTLAEKIGQMLVLGWSGADAYLALNDHARGIIADLKPGGLVLLGRNVQRGSDPIDAHAVKAMLTEAQSLSKTPLLIAVDQEGGRVARFGNPPFTRMPTARAVGERGDATLAGEAAFATGTELAAVGIHVNFAPVADVNSNSQNPVIGDRAFGTTVAQVCPMVAAQVAGYTRAGILPCLKHFPGHGDTTLDSHHDLPTLPYSVEAMEARELVPFQTETPAMMTAHIVFTAVDADHPATMSRAILTGLLRERMGFGGLLYTDCLEMKAVSERWGTPQAALAAAQAGADALLICHTEAVQRETFALLLRAAESGALPLARIDEAVARVQMARQKATSLSPPPLSVIGCAAHQAVRDAFSVAISTEASTLGEA
jgi:beta-N-acetylhexosaminidase